MRVINSASVVLMVLGAITSVLAHPIALPFLKRHTDLETRALFARAIDPDFKKLAQFGIDHRKHIGVVGKPGVHFPATLANGDRIIGESKGDEIHAEDDAIAQANAKGTHIVKGVPVGVDRKLPQSGDHIAKVCEKCLPKLAAHGAANGHTVGFPNEQGERLTLNKQFGLQHKFSSDPHAGSDDPSFQSNSRVGTEGSGPIADSVKSNKRPAAQKPAIKDPSTSPSSSDK